MTFETGTVEALKIEDKKISDLLYEVYVSGGFIDVANAKQLFEPSLVRKRGLLLVTREVESSQVVAMLVIVPFFSPSCRFAKEGEAEIHLLGVKPAYRRQGLGEALVQKAIDRAKLNGYTKLILWTQQSMKPAQILYEGFGFIQISNFVSNERKFKLYELVLNEQQI